MNSPRSIVSRNATPAGGQSESTSGLIEIPASELRPGDRVSFGDHTGWYRIKRVWVVPAPNEHYHDTVRVTAWPRWFYRWPEFRATRFVSADETAWVQR